MIYMLLDNIVYLPSFLHLSEVIGHIKLIWMRIIARMVPIIALKLLENMKNGEYGSSVFCYVFKTLNITF